MWIKFGRVRRSGADPQANARCCGQKSSLSSFYRLERILVRSKDALNEIGIAVLDKFGDLISAKLEHDAVFVVIAPTALGLDIASDFSNNKIAFRNKVDNLRPVLRRE